jgi:hypothetical protein
MSWVYVPGLAVSSSGSTLPEPTREPSVWSRGKPMQLRSLQRAWRRDPWIRLLSGLTSEPSTLHLGADSWIASLRATHVSPTVSRESARGPTTTAGSSSASSISWAPYGLRVFSGRTSRGTQTDSSRPSSPHWKEWATALRLEFSQRAKLEPAIGESDFLSWPTPTALNLDKSHQPGTCASHEKKLEMAKQWQTPATDSFRSRGGDRKDEMGLDQQARLWPTPRTISGGPESGERKQELGRTESGGGDLQAAALNWPTPRAEDSESSGATVTRGIKDTLTAVARDAAESWPTPMSRDYRSGHTRQTDEELWGKKGKPLERVATSHSSRQDQATPDGQPSSAPRRSLNPQFVEWLMGWPQGWTRCDTGSTDCAAAVMEFQVWLQRMRGALLKLCSPRISKDAQGSLF